MEDKTVEPIFLRTPATFSEARSIQEYIASNVARGRLTGRPAFVAGVDAAYLEDMVFAVACLFRLPGLEHLETAQVNEPVNFPYVPGFLSFREGPPMIKAILNLKQKPDILLVDGQGIAHPRKAGIASFIGLAMGIPSVGCAKSRLVGLAEEPAKSKGSRSDLIYKGEIVGVVLRTRNLCRPVFVSPGYGVTVDEAIGLVLACTARFRIPEPIRMADQCAAKLKRIEIPPG